MNNSRDLVKRLLHLLPIKIVKEHFSVTGNAEEVIDEVSGSNTSATVKSFIFDNLRATKQNIYLYTLSSRFNRSTFDISTIPYTLEKEVIAPSNEYNFYFLPRTSYSVYLSDPTDKESLVFFLPVLIRIKQKALTIHFTKLEKKINTYFPPNRLAKPAEIQNDEDKVLREILTAFSDINYSSQPTDINAGVKHLWAIDAVDCHKIQWRKSHSVSTEVMDGTLTFKQKYPTEYTTIIQTPLENSIWKYLLTDERLCEKFSINPTKGTVSITQFPKDINQVNNVINKILENN